MTSPPEQVLAPPAATRTAQPYATRFLAWLTRALLAALVLAGLELPHVLTFLPAASSDPVGFTWYVTQLVCLFMLLGVPLAALGARFERPIEAGIEATSPALLLTLAIGAGLAVAFAEHLGALTGADQARQFPERMDMFRGFVDYAGMLVLAVFCWGVLYRFTRLLFAHAPNLARPRVAVALASLALVVAGVLVTDFALFAIHLDELTPPVTAGCVGLLLLVGFCSWRSPGPRARKTALAISVGLVLIEPVGPLRDPHALFVLHNHSPLAGPVMMYAGLATDFDRDGVPGRWLGGADCDDFDAKRNPTRRDPPGDGLDQDCSGRDSLPDRTPPPRITPLVTGCDGVPAKPSIVLITVEALRASAIRPEVTPNLVRFAQYATRFNRAYTASTYTMHSTLALFTGQAMTAITAANPLGNQVYCAGQTVTAALAGAGYRTGAYCYITASKAINSGFMDTNYHPEPFDALPSDLLGGQSVLTSALLTRSAIRYVEEFGDEPYFLWVHYIDTHASYDGPPNYASSVQLSPYEQTAAYVDHHVGRLIDYLVRTGRSGNTAIVVTADHGEDLGMRGKEGHGPFLFEEAVHVPLLVWVPGCPGRDVNVPVGLSQLAPTFAGLGHVAFPGQPLFLDSSPVQTVVAENLSRYELDQRLLRAVVDGRHKLIVDVKNGGRMLFDLAEDPLEQSDIYRAQPEVAARLERSYRRWLERSDNRWRPGCAPGLDLDGGVPARFGGSAAAVAAPH